MNILFLLDSALPTVCRGGIERATEVLARELRRRGNAVRILAWRNEQDASAEFPQGVFPRAKPRDAKENQTFFARTLHKEKVDVVVFQCGAGWKFPFPKEIRALGVPAVSVIHTVPNSYAFRYREKYSGLARWWNTRTKRWRQARKYRFNCDVCARTVVLSESHRSVLEKFLTREQIAGKKIAAIGNMAAYPSVPADDISDKKKELLFVGRMSFAEKRPDLLLRVWAKLQAAFPEWSLRFVGDGDYLPELKQLAGTLGAERVRFEGFASFGCVPVAFDSFAAARDIIDDGGNGCLVPAFDLDAYAETLARLMSDDALRERLAKNALAQIPEKFSPEKIGAQWEALFAELIGRKRNTD